MTNEQPQTSPLTLGWLTAQLDEAHLKEAYKNVGEWSAKMFETMLKAARDAMPLERPPEAEQLGYYYTKTINEWEEQRLKFPEDFEREQAQFGRLRQKEAEGKLVAAKPQYGLPQHPMVQASNQMPEDEASATMEPPDLAV